MSRPDLPALCAQLVELQARRKFFIAATNKQTNAAGSYARRALGWRMDLPEAEAKAINARADRIVTAALSGKALPAGADAVMARIGADVAVIARAVDPLDAARAEVEREMVRAARHLPASEWLKGVRGFGEKAFAVIVGEAGDLSNYATRERLWKRLGLAPFEGKAGKTWRVPEWRDGAPALTSEQWTEFGYSGKRLGQVFGCLTEPLLKHQSIVGGPYRAAYERRRAHTAETHPEWTKAHSHSDALRIMAKDAISDLWSEWRRSSRDLPIMAIQVVTAADPLPPAASPITRRHATVPLQVGA